MCACTDNACILSNYFNIIHNNTISIISLTVSSFWESGALKPLGLATLMAYMMESVIAKNPSSDPVEGSLIYF